LQKNISLEEVRNLNNGEERYDAFIEMMPIISRYNTFVMAKNIGITYGPQDMTYEDLKHFNAIQNMGTAKEDVKHGKR